MRAVLYNLQYDMPSRILYGYYSVSFYTHERTINVGPNFRVHFVLNSRVKTETGFPSNSTARAGT